MANGRHVASAQSISEAALRDYDQSASALLIDGGFNINSTSEEAWRAVLAATFNNPVGNESLQSKGDNRAPVPRMVHPISDSNVMTAQRYAEFEPESFSGYRALSLEQISNLAVAIVDQVKKRGPFVSMADFVNPALNDNTQTSGSLSDLRKSGALHAAIVDSRTKINAAFTMNGDDILKLPDVGAGFTRYNYEPDPNDPISLSTHSPGWVSQADLLQVLGSTITARSDTFKIRVYGEVLNPLDSNQVLSRAWAEAIVQRTPDYLVPSEIEDADGANGDVAWAAWTDTLKNEENKNFGRRFKIISFRWLSPSDI